MRYLKPEEMLPKEGDLVNIMVLFGSLIVNPMEEKEKNVQMFNDWVEKTYGNS